MNIFNRIAIVVFLGLSVSTAVAHNKVVVIPLGGTPSIKTKMAFPRMSIQCLSEGFVTFQVLFDGGTPQSSLQFFIDDRDTANPIITFVENGPTLPASTSHLTVAISALFSASFGDTLDAVIGDSIGGQQFNDLNDCSNATTSISAGSTNIEENTLTAVSITGKSWEITSNVTVRDGVLTLGPTLFQLIP